MLAVFVVASIVMVAVVGASAFVIARKSSREQAAVQQFQASLAKNLPPDVQTDMKLRPLGPVTSVAILVVVLPIVVAGMIRAAKPAEVLKVGAGLVGAVGCAAWRVSIARPLLGRWNPGEVLADLSPYPLAGAVRRISWISWGCMAVPTLFAFIPFAVTGFQTAGDRLFWVVWMVFMLLLLLTNLMYSDRVWLAERGLYLGGGLYAWEGFERLAWTDDGRAFALRRRLRWSLQRWTVAPWTVVAVPEGSRAAAEEALRQVMPGQR